MLILQRCAGQSILIGDQIKILFLREHKGCMEIGIEAPKNIVVLRSEIVDRPIKKLNLIKRCKKEIR